MFLRKRDMLYFYYKIMIGKWLYTGLVRIGFCPSVPADIRLQLLMIQVDEWMHISAR